MTPRNFRWILTIVVAALVAVFILWSPAEAKKKKKRKKAKSKQVLFFDASIRTTYDENIIRYSDADLDLYDADAGTEKFDIESQDDWIIKSQIETRLKGNFIADHSAWIGLRYNYYFYVNNDIRRFQKFGVFARHYFRPGGYLEAEYSRIPDYYYRNQYISPLDTYVKANFSKNYFKLEMGLDLSKSLKADISYRFQSKTYNPEVSERDLTANGFRLDGIWKASKKVKFWAYYGFESANAAGADLLDLDTKDVSYDGWDITIRARYYSCLHRKMRPEFFSTIQIREIIFRTTKYRDEYRFDREDHNFRIRVGTALRIFYDVRFDIYYTYQQKRVDLPIQALESALEYQASSVSFGFRRRF